MVDIHTDIHIYTRKMVPITGRASSFLEKNVFLKTNIKLNPFLYALLSSSVSRANRIYHLLQSCFSFIVRLHGQPEQFGRSIILQFCCSIFSLHGQPELFASDILLQSYHLASIFEWLGAVSRGLLFLTTSFPLVVFWFSFLLYPIRVLSSAFLSSVFQSLCLL